MVSTQEQETLQLRALKLQTSIKGWIKAHFPSLPSLYGITPIVYVGREQ